MSLENAIIFKAKKGNRINRDKDNSLYFSITTTSRNYNSIKFYIGSNLARKTKINENSRLQLACDRDDKTIWYLVAGDEGYSVRKDKHGEYSSIMNFPFEYIEKKMQGVSDKNISVDSDKRIITIYVFEIFSNSALVLKN